METNIFLEGINSSKVEIRMSNLNDFDLFWETFKETINDQFTEYSPKIRNYFLEDLYSKDNLRQWLSRKEIFIVLAINNKKVVGYLLGTFPFNGISYVIWMTVKNNFRRKGIGSALLSYYENLLKQEDASKINLWSSGDNSGFYRGQGYRPILKDSLKIQEWLFCKKIN